MRLLVLGGTVFLSHAVASEAVARGHEVVCACRGTSGSVPDGAELVVWDRDQEPPAELAGPFDAAVDVGRVPSQVSKAVNLAPEAHWTFVSSVNVYSDLETASQSIADTPLHEPMFDDADWRSDSDVYGQMKVACEHIVAGRAASHAIVRPGLIVGPGDPSGRFTYWPVRLAGGGPIAAPGDPAKLVQVIDVRDLARWIVRLADHRTSGTFDAVGEHITMRDLLLTGDPWADLIWMDPQFLTEHGIEPWSGPDSLPVWLPSPELDGMLTRLNGPAVKAGLEFTPLESTFADTAAWVEAEPDANVTGISREREAEILQAWFQQTGSRIT